MIKDDFLKKCQICNGLHSTEEHTNTISDYGQEVTENPFLLNATPENLAANKKIWIDKCKTLCHLRGITENELLHIEAIIKSLKLHHTTTVDSLIMAIKHGALLSSHALDLANPQHTVSKNTYANDVEFGLDNFVYLRLGGEHFRALRRGTVILNFNNKLLLGPNTFVSIQDSLFAFEAEKYGGGVNGWQMYLKENFFGKDYLEVLKYLIAATFSKPDDFTNSAIPDLPMPHIPRVNFLMSRQIQSEVKILNYVDLSMLESISVPNGDVKTIEQLKAAGFNDKQIIATK